MSPARPSRVSLRTTLVGLLLATVAVMCLVVGLVTHASVRDQLSAQLDAQLARASDRALRHAGGPGSGEDPGQATSDQAALPPAGAGDPGGGEFELTARIVDGSVTDASWRDKAGDVQELDSADRAALRQAAQAFATTSEGATDGSGPGVRGEDITLSIGAYRVIASTAEDGSTLVSGVPRGSMQSTLTRLDLTLLLASLGALAVTGVAGSLIVRRTMRPLEDVARIASDVATMPLETGSVTLAERAPPARAGTEVGEVARAMNHLLDNVEGALDTRQRSEERMRRFIADASHELRTPLTSIRGYTEILRLTEDLSDRGQQSVDRLDAQSRRMTSLVEDLLLLARLDDGAPRDDVPLDLGEIVVESVLDAQVTGPDHTWTFDVPDEPVTVRGDERQLTQVVVNLLSNARKHTPSGTAVDVGLGTRDRAWAVLRIADDGPGIDPSLRGEVFSRFTRADTARSGSDPTTGLGLPIVKAIAEGHGGSIDVASRPGQTVFTVTLPLAS